MSADPFAAYPDAPEDDAFAKYPDAPDPFAKFDTIEEAPFRVDGEGRVLIDPARPASALIALNGSGMLSDGELAKRLGAAKDRQARAASPHASTAELMQNDPVVARTPRWEQLPMRELGPDEPALSSEAGRVFLNPTRMPEALKAARDQGVISQSVYDNDIKSAYMVQQAALHYHDLRKRAGEDAGINAFAAGAGRAIVSLGAGIGTGAAVASVAPESAFTSLALVPGAAVAAGETAGQVYDAVLPDSLQAARELHGGAYAAGDLATAVAPAPIGLARALKAASLVNQSRGALAATAFLAKPALAGATGVAVAQGLDKLMDPDSHASPAALALGGAFGVAMAGLPLKFKDYSAESLADIWSRGADGAKQGLAPTDVLRPEEREVFEAMKTRFKSVIEDGKTFDPAAFDVTAQQATAKGKGKASETEVVGQEQGGRVPVGAVALDVQGEQTPAPLAAPEAADPPEPSESEAEFESQQATPSAITRGGKDVVIGANGKEYPSTYIWAPTARIEPSHTGETLAPNPNYPLANTRDYSDPAEKDKALATRNEWDPRRAITDSPDAAVGPPAVAQVIDEQGKMTLAVVGGNNRQWAMQNLSPEKAKATFDLSQFKRSQFGLPEGYTGTQIARYLGMFDLRKAGERDKLQSMVDSLNPSPGMIQSTAKRAEIDAATVPADKLAGASMAMAPADAQSFVRGLIAGGLADRNRLAATAASGSQSQDYVQRLIINAGFQQPAIAEGRNDVRAPATARAMIDAAAPVLVQMRALGANQTADAISKAFATTFSYLDEAGAKLPEALERAAQQMELDPAHAAAQDVAAALRTTVVTDKAGKVQEEPTIAGVRALFEKMSAAVKERGPEGQLGLFGEQESVEGTVRRVAALKVVERIVSDAPESSAPAPGPSPKVEAEKILVANEAREQLHGAPSGYALVAVDAKGGGFANVPMQGLDDIKIIQMPEMVALARELTGILPTLKRMPKAMGRFVPLGNGMIKLDPRIFADPTVAAKVLAHEIGHLDDYLPDKTLKRGNLWGRIHSLKGYLKDKFGSTLSSVSNKGMRKELIEVTKYWRPYDPDTDKPSYVAYRQSAAELYADAISVLFNSPATLKAMAPTFYREFFRGLDSKPEVKRTFFEVQRWLNRPAEQIAADRALKVTEMFGKGEETYERKAAEREERYKGYRGWLSRLKQGFFDNYNPVRERGEEAGTKEALEVNRFLFDAHPLSENRVYQWLERVHSAVVKPAEAAGVSMDDMGQRLFFNRIANESYPLSERLAESLGVSTGGRSVIANPLGHTPETARLQLLDAQLKNTAEREASLKDAVSKFHDAVFQPMEEAHAAELFTDEQMDMIRGNRDNYATFVPLEYLDTFVPSGIYNQAGTFSDVENPFPATARKVITLIRAIEMQRIKQATVKLLTDHFPAEIARAEVRRDAGGRETPAPVRERGMKQIMLREAGKPVWYNVPSEIADMFERTASPRLDALFSLLDAPFRKIFYPIFITYNPIFQLVRNPMRDSRRTFINAPQGVGFWDIARQLPLIKQIGKNDPLKAVRDFVKSGVENPLIADMLDNLAITRHEATYVTTADRPQNTFERMLQEHGLLPENEQARFWETKLGGSIRGVGRSLENAGKMNELLPKVSTYRILTTRLGWEPKEAAFYVRNYVGTPHFGRRGAHINMVNPFVPFVNIWTKGWAADVDLAVHGYKRVASPDEPGKSAASWWMRWALSSGLWTVIKVAGVLGLLGAVVKKSFDAIGGHYLTNYDVIPLGRYGTSDYSPEGKVAFIPIPKDPTDRVLSGITYNTLLMAGRKLAAAGTFGDEIKAVNAGTDDRLQTLLGHNMSIGASDMPGLNPLIKIAIGWGTYLEGQNPYDDYRQRFILSDNEYLAGGAAGAESMIGWTYNQTGAQSFISYNPQARTTWEMIMPNIPVVNGMVKITDYGLREQQKAAQTLQEGARAAMRLGMPANAQQLNSELGMLTKISPNLRTSEQVKRLRQLETWRAAVYAPAEERLTRGEKRGMSSEQSAEIRAKVGERSQRFMRSE